MGLPNPNNLSVCTHVYARMPYRYLPGYYCNSVGVGCLAGVYVTLKIFKIKCNIKDTYIFM